METREFLQRVVTTESGYFLIALRLADGAWHEQFFEWPNDLDTIIAIVDAAYEKADVYYSPYLFREPKSTKEYVLPSRTIAADLDEADIHTLPFTPTVIVETSPGRHQGYWVLAAELPLAQHEDLSYRLTYSIPLCDHSGWYLGKKLRVPGTTNYKYTTNPSVRVIIENDVEHEYDDLALLPPSRTRSSTKANEEWTDDVPRLSVGAQTLLESVRGSVSTKVYNQYNIEQSDRSAALWALMCAAFRAGLDRNSVYHLAQHSANNKFAQLRYNGDRELAKDVLRAEEEVRTNSSNIREVILSARKLPGAAHERRQYMQKLILENMTATGAIIKTDDERVWYVEAEQGRPIYLSAHSEQLQTLMDVRYGLNGTEVEQRYVIHGLCAAANAAPISAVNAALSHYDATHNALYIHTGRKDVIRITGHSIDIVTNGLCGVVFPWLNNVDPFTIDLNSDLDWGEFLFRGTVDVVIEMDKEAALAALKAWFMFLLFRDAAITRPVLAMLGQIGSGKTALFHQLFTLLYGTRKHISKVTTRENFDQAIQNDPLAVFDNVDTYEKWLADSVAASIANIDVTVRKLYTDQDTVIRKQQAMIALSAFSPKFIREDISDRLLLIKMERRQKHIPETVFIDNIMKHRAQLWGSIVKTIQRILLVPRPMNGVVPEFRVADFAQIGYWASIGMDCTNDFRTAIDTVRRNQRLISIEEDAPLVSAIDKFVQTGNDEWMTVGTLWQKLELRGDTHAFKAKYENAQNLGKKMWAIQEALREMYNVENRFDATKGTRLWRITSAGGNKD